MSFAGNIAGIIYKKTLGYLMTALLLTLGIWLGGFDHGEPINSDTTSPTFTPVESAELTYMDGYSDGLAESDYMDGYRNGLSDGWDDAKELYRN